MPASDSGAMPRPAHHATGNRLSAALLTYYLAVIGVVTLVPFDFVVPADVRVLLYGTPFDVTANVLMFIPVGFLVRLTRPSASGRLALDVLASGLLASLLIETAQLFEPARFTSPLDVLANGTGAWLGALACDRTTRGLRPDALLLGRLSLEIPLMGLAWLVIPLLWLGSVAAAGDPVSIALLALPGLFGATLVADVHRYRLGRPGEASSGRLAWAVAAGTAAGVFPAAGNDPVLAAAIVAAAAAHARAAAARPPAAGADRRFELATLRRALPFLALYLLARAWTGGPAPLEAAETAQILRILELAGLFTVLGYVLAEWRGRLELSLAESAFGVFARALPLAAIAMAGRFLPDSPVQAVLWTGAGVAAALAGAGLYGLQRAHIVALIAATRGAGHAAARPSPVPVYRR